MTLRILTAWVKLQAFRECFQLTEHFSGIPWKRVSRAQSRVDFPDGRQVPPLRHLAPIAEETVGNNRFAGPTQFAAFHDPEQQHAPKSR